MIAVTDIEHGGEDGKVTRIAAGDRVDEGKFSKEQLASLKASGAVVDKSEGLEPQDREAKIAQLRAELAELESAATVAPPTPGNAAHQLHKANAESRSDVVTDDKK